MNTKAILAGLAGGVFAFFGGWLVYGILLMDFTSSHAIPHEGVMKNPPDMIFLVISNLSWGYLLAYIFYKWANIKTFGAGFTGGLIISFLVVFMIDTSLYAFYNLSDLTGTVADILIGSVFGGLIGGVVGWVLGTGNKE